MGRPRPKSFVPCGFRCLDPDFKVSTRVYEHRETPTPVSNAVHSSPSSVRETLVVIPAKNESGTIGKIVGQVLSNGLSVVVVDDASTDATAEVARAAGATVMRLVNPLGAWGATQTGIRYALKHGFKQVVTLDADGQHPVELIPELLAPVISGQSDVTIGSCVGRGSPLRKVAWFMFRKTGGLKVADLTSGFRCYNARGIRLLSAREATLIDYQDIGVLFLLLEAGLRIQEVEITMCARLSGHSRIFNTWLAVGKYMMLSTVLAVSKNLYRQNMGHGRK